MKKTKNLIYLAVLCLISLSVASCNSDDDRDDFSGDDFSGYYGGTYGGPYFDTFEDYEKWCNGDTTVKHGYRFKSGMIKIERKKGHTYSIAFGEWYNASEEYNAAYFTPYGGSSSISIKKDGSIYAEKCTYRVYFGYYSDIISQQSSIIGNIKDKQLTMIAETPVYVIVNFGGVMADLHKYYWGPITFECEKIENVSDWK